MTQFLGISGSLRKGSYNSALLRAAAELLPAGVELQTARIDDLPPYNDDVRAAGFPPPAERLREEIRRADAVLFVTPEYNYSVPGVLKNAIDWASRPPDQPFNEKPVAIMGASPSQLGTGRAQYHLRQTCVFLNAFVLSQPEVMVNRAHERFDEQGVLQDEATKKIVAQQLEALVRWIERLRR